MGGIRCLPSDPCTSKIPLNLVVTGRVVVMRGDQETQNKTLLYGTDPNFRACANLGKFAKRKSLTGKSVGAFLWDFMNFMT